MKNDSRESNVSTFGNYLVEILKQNRFSMEYMCEWIASPEIQDFYSTKFGVKEHLRVLREKKIPVTRYPLYNSIVSFFEAHSKPVVADRLRYIFLTQSQDQGLIRSTFSDSPQLEENLLWLYRPPIGESVLSRNYEIWKFNCFNGDHDLYRRSMAFYREQSNSYVHVPIRRRIAIDLARAGVLHGDYLFAFLIAHRFGTAFREFIKSKTGRFGHEGSYEIASEDFDAFLSSLQIVATSVSHLSFNNPFYPSKEYFAEAEHVLEAAHEGSRIDKPTYIKQRFNLKVRYLRMLSRCQLQFEPEAIRGTIIDEEITRTLGVIERMIDSGEDQPDSFVLNDTRARVHILKETPNDIALAEKYFKLALNVKRQLDSEDRIQMGEPSKLRRLRSETTRSLLYAVTASRQTGTHEDLENRLTHASQILTDLVREIGPDNTWHTRLLIAEVQRKIDSIAGHINGSTASNMLGIPQVDEERNLRERIERRSNSYAELLFAVEDMKSHESAIHQSNYISSVRQVGLV